MPDSPSRYDRDIHKFGDSPSPMFTGILWQLQLNFWMVEDRLPDAEELRMLVAEAASYEAAFLDNFESHVEEAERFLRYRAKCDDITAWTCKSDRSLEYFDADEDCMDPDADDHSFDGDSTTGHYDDAGFEQVNPLSE